MIRTARALAVAAAISMVAYGTSNAAPIAPLPAAQTETSAMTPVYYRHYHYYYHRPWRPYGYYWGWRPYRYYWGYPYRYYYWGYPYRYYYGYPYYPYRWGWRRWWW